MFKVIIAVVAVAILAKADKTAQITQYENNLRADGTYNYRYDTSNGIAANENGLGGYATGGSVQWISPEGIPIFLRYEADANGYRPVGSHLPTSPPIPDYILKSIEENRIAEEQRSRQKKNIH